LSTKSKIFFSKMEPSKSLAHAIVIISIVLGGCVVAIALSFIVNLYKHYGTLDSEKMRKLKW
jgi:multicomponent Na+:H+ antiporter subunit C